MEKTAIGGVSVSLSLYFSTVQKETGEIEINLNLRKHPFLMKDREFSLMVGTLSGLLLMIPSKPERDPDHPSLIHTLPLSLESIGAAK